MCENIRDIAKRLHEITVEIFHQSINLRLLPSPPTPRKSSNYLREKRQEYLHEGMEYLELNCLQVMPPYFANKGPSGQSYSFPSGHVWM